MQIQPNTADGDIVNRQPAESPDSESGPDCPPKKRSRSGFVPVWIAILGVISSVTAFLVLQNVESPASLSAWIVFGAPAAGLLVTTLLAICLHLFLTQRIRIEETSGNNAEDRRQQASLCSTRILEALPFGVFVIGRDRRIRMVNQAALDMMGRQHEEILGHVCQTHICSHQDKGCPVLDHGKTMEQVECTLLHTDDAGIPILKTVVPIELDGEEFLLESFIDLSRRKESEENLRKAKEQAEALNEELRQQTLLARQMAFEAKVAADAKGQFLTNMSHEIRTPLNGVMGMNQLLMESSLDPDQRGYVETIHTCGEQLLKMIEDVLDYSKIESGQLQLNIVDFDPRSMMEDTAAPLALMAHQKHLAFSHFIDPAIPGFLRGDPSRLRRILINLIDNAVKFTNDGEVAATVTLEEETPTCATLRFSVRDTGIGVAPEDHEQVFELFTQLDASMTRQHGGAGLGLTLARQFVLLMDGDIQVHSDVGEGADFGFTLTFEKQPDAFEAPSIPAELVNLPILVVDENATSRQVLRRYLQSSSCRVRDASDIDEAKKILETACREGLAAAGILVSRSLPDNGAEILAQYIHQNPTPGQPPLILLTTLVQQENARCTEELGFDEYVLKPIQYCQAV